MGKFYWLKLKKDFFKRHDMMILESMTNGWLYEMIFVKLLAESIDHNGELRFSESIPYNSSMLSVICRIDEETMKAALEIFKELGLVVVDDNQTISLPIAKNMIGSAEDNDVANRQRRCRERKALSGECDNDVTKCHTEVTENVTSTLQKITRDRDRHRDRERDRDR